MKITLTGINFVFGNGYDQDFTAVNLNFTSSGTGMTFNLSGYVEVSKEQYLAATTPDAMKGLIKQEVLNKLQESEAE
ncbi:hypothetical protein B4102_3578 [Heyndrickxia sporothermodurans]|uniref:Uncharacterized protein n=1 Tax=Heyndrickxia sporothermodurans TaxID=46224 RepID=A0A150KLE5_9BACI|nr:hypothetical protein [Heyndrickxia sporothermodurans]KYC94357.1 hypothetical protein B4102_3578 [Heyndrickxia sporothermodurans]